VSGKKGETQIQIKTIKNQTYGERDKVAWVCPLLKKKRQSSIIRIGPLLLPGSRPPSAFRFGSTLSLDSVITKVAVVPPRDCQFVHPEVRSDKIAAPWEKRRPKSERKSKGNYMDHLPWAFQDFRRIEGRRGGETPGGDSGKLKLSPG